MNGDVTGDVSGDVSGDVYYNDCFYNYCYDHSKIEGEHYCVECFEDVLHNFDSHEGLTIE